MEKLSKKVKKAYKLWYDSEVAQYEADVKRYDFDIFFKKLTDKQKVQLEKYVLEENGEEIL